MQILTARRSVNTPYSRAICSRHTLSCFRVRSRRSIQVVSTIARAYSPGTRCASGRLGSGLLQSNTPGQSHDRRDLHSPCLSTCKPASLQVFSVVSDSDRTSPAGQGAHDHAAVASLKPARSSDHCELRPEWSTRSVSSPRHRVRRGAADRNNERAIASRSRYCA